MPDDDSDQRPHKKSKPGKSPPKRPPRRARKRVRHQRRRGKGGGTRTPAPRPTG